MEYKAGKKDERPKIKDNWCNTVFKKSKLLILYAEFFLQNRLEKAMI